MRITIFPLVVLTLACSSRPLADDEAGSTTSPGETSESGESDGSSASASSDESTSASTSSSTTFGDCPFFPCMDIPVDNSCDPFLQDCPEGEKCVPYAANGGSWDDNKCVPVLGDNAPGEPCTWAGIMEATDDCDASSICWYTELVDDQYVGYCVAQCTGNADTPECPPDSQCFLNRTLALCFPVCDPIAQDCSEGFGCYWNASAFECEPMPGEIPAGQPCGFINDCAPGNLCADVSVVPSCAGSACCTAYCNLPDGDAGCVAQPGTACVAFFEDGTAPAGYEHVGVCIVPP